MEPFLGIMLDKQPRPNHLQLRVIFQNLYKQMMEPIEGLSFSGVVMHALPALCDGFSRTYKKSWMDSFSKHLEKYDASKVETVMRTIMKQLAATLSRQRGIQYEFGPEYEEYCAKKSAGLLEVTHLRPLSEVFSEEQLEAIPIDNKVGENYFGQMTNQLRAKGSTAFKAINERLVLKSNADIAFAEGAEKMLKDKELKKKQKEIVQIEAEWSKAQRDVIRAKIAISDSEADILAREQTKNKALALCMDNGRRFKYNSPVSSQEDVNKMYNKIQKLSEQDQLSIMRREVKFKKLLFSDLPSDFKLFRQHNISAKVMYQNLLQLHAVDESNQEIISVEDIYEITDTLSSLNIGKQKGKSKNPIGPSTTSGVNQIADLEWPPHEEEFVITLDEEGWNLGSVQAYIVESDEIEVQPMEPLQTRAKDDHGKTYWSYTADDNPNSYKKNHILDLRPSVSLAKNIKRKDPVFALLNREMVESVSQSLYS